MIDKARETALKTLVKIEKEEGYSNIVLNQVIKENKKILTEKDISLISEIVYGVISYKITLDEIIKKYSSIKLKKISIWILNVLRMGIYQIIFLDKIPKSAAVNESVNLAKRYGHKASSNFVNAILRKVEKKDYNELFEIKDNVQRISKTTSMPEWIVKELAKNNEYKEVEEICNNLNKKPKINIRINRLKTNVDEVKEELKKQNIIYNTISEDKEDKEDKEAEENIKNIKNKKIKKDVKNEENTKDDEDFLELEKIKDIENNKLFKNGFFTIQDISAGMTAKILSPKPNEFVLDACAAPGGKTTYMAELMDNKGKIIAGDIYEHRLNLIKQNAKRLGISIIETKILDATKYYKEYEAKFDKILLDVPCLGIGVIKRKPDIKWQRKPEDLQEICKIQEIILENCSKYLKIGGELVYSTCSILEEENENIIKEFVKKNQNFEIKKVKNTIKIFENFIKKEGYISIKPTEKNDGFFICKLVKK